MQMTRVVVAGAALAVAGAAYGKSVRIDGLGGAVLLEAKDVSDIVFGAGATPPTFSTGSLTALHADLNADGIVTNNMISVVFAKTSFGFSLLTLVDNQEDAVTFDRVTATLGFSSAVQRSDTLGPNQWINDQGGDIAVSVDEPGNFQAGLGTFEWDSVSGFGDAFAWSDLAAGDFISNNFTELAAGFGFQFITFDGAEWQVAETAEFSGAGQFAYAARVIPLPTGGALGVVGLAGLAAMRRRRG